MKRRFFSLLIACIMLLTMLPHATFAAEAHKKQLIQVNCYDSTGNLRNVKKIHYGSNGQITSVITEYVAGSSSSTTFVYDSAGRMTERHDIEARYSAYFTYNSKGQKIEADLNYGREWYSYDSNGRLLAIKGSFDAHDYITTNTYNPAGLLVSAKTEYAQYDGGKYTETISYSYDSQGRLTKEECVDKHGTSSKTYNHSYAPFVITESTNSFGNQEIYANYNDSTGYCLFMIPLSNPQFFADADGYLTKATSSNGTYEFIYDDLPTPFYDVHKEDYYCDSVVWAINKGITLGTSATTFGPEDSCTRAQVVTFLWRAAGEPKPVATSCPFHDVQAKEYYYTPVLWAVENEITAGDGNAYTFNPDGKCTRAQIVTFLYRFMT